MNYAQYETLTASARPSRQISEKDALKLLRTAKKERAEDFQTGMPKAKIPELLETGFSAVAAYYSVSNGGHLSDEYELLSYLQAQDKTKDLVNQLEAEEDLLEKPSGIVIASCSNGDSIPLLDVGSVIRFSHEVPETTDQWPSLAQFIAEAIQDTP